MSSTSNFIENTETPAKGCVTIDGQPLADIHARLQRLEELITGRIEEGPKSFLYAPEIALRYHRSTMTIRRWRKDLSVGFPKPDIIIHDRPAWNETTLVQWERERAARAS